MEPTENHGLMLRTIGATLLLTTSLLVTACSPSNSYRVTIENRNSQPVDEFLLKVAEETISLGELQPAERRERELKINRNSTIGYQFKTGDQCYSGVLEERAPAGASGNKTLLIGEQGAVTIIDEIRHTENKKAAGEPEKQEWALPCMIPG